jgi:RHS repeat-associated protein
MSGRTLLQHSFSHTHVIQLPIVRESRYWSGPILQPSVRKAKHPLSRASGWRFLLCTAVVLIFSARVARTQVNPGTPSFSAYDSGEYDTVNLQNLSVSLHVPLMSKSGAFPLALGMTGGDSFVYAVSGNLYPGAIAYPLITAAQGGILGYTGSFAVSGAQSYGVMCPVGDGSGSATKYLNWYIQFADGTVHPLPGTDISYSGATCSGGFTDQTVDGSGYTLSVTGATVNSIYYKNGTHITTSAITDSNSNSISWNGLASWTDTLGLTAISAHSGGGYQWTDVNGGHPYMQVTNTLYTSIQSAFGCSTFADYNATASPTLPTTIRMADGSTVVLGYEVTQGHSGSTTGRLTQITLRDGVSTVGFNYNPGNLGAPYNLNCTYAMPNSMTRTTSDGAVTYSIAFSANGSYWKSVTTKLDIGKNKTMYTFTGLTSTGIFPPAPMTQALTQKAYYANGGTVSAPSYSGTPTKLEIYCYNNSSPTVANCPTTNVSLPVTEVDVFTQLSGMSNYARHQIQYDGGPSGSCGSGTGGCYGNVTSVSRYDYGILTPTSVTTTTYGGCGTGSNVNDKPCEMKTAYAGTVSDEKFTYSSAGSVLTVAVSPNGGSTFIGNSTPNVYNSNGTPSKTYDLANNETDYTYASGSYSDGCSGSAYTVFPTNIKNVGTGINTSATYDCTGGVKLHDMDASGNVTIYGYQSSGGAADPLWRVMSITDPLGNETWKTYFQSGPIGPYTESALSFGTSSVDNEWRTTDGYGRPILFQKAQSSGGSNYDTVSTAYNFSGVNPTVFTSIPCSAASAATCPNGVTTTLDMFGRPLTIVDGGGGTDTISYSQNDVLTTLSPYPSGENNKAVQNEFDGLGRLRKSCFISSTASGEVTCGENTGSSSGILTSYSYTSGTGYQTTSAARGPGPQTRSTKTDGIGRVIQKITPEGGTVTDTYDYTSGSPCGGTYNFPGKLVLETSANGNFRCYDYDALGRLLDVSAGYSGGGTTTCRRFRYDSTTGVLGSLPTGVSIANTSGRIAEAETDNCVQPVTATLTDEWFSYNANGQVTDFWESTPNSGTYYHSTATYSGPSLVTTQLTNPSFYTAAYTLDGEGRWNAFTTGSTNYVSGTTYTAAQQPSTISLYSTDYDSYSYDSNTARMKGWTFQVNSVQETAIVDWNTNGTLKDLQIIDGFNSGGTQTCDFNSGRTSSTGYDDLGRLIGVSCGPGGSIWNQQFSYDQYDNLTKSSIGFVPWNPGYSSSTNHYTCTGCTYDSSGNVTYDGTNSYQWNEFNKMKSVNGSGTNCSTGGDCNTYDAFGRLVETDPHGGNKVEIWYTQSGKVFMTASSIDYAYWPTGGGGKQIVIGTSNYFVHKDWLGNGRIVSTLAGHAIQSDMAYAPYGEVYDIFGSTQAKFQGFNGDSTQDVFAGMYETPNRQLQGSQQGRWLSPDPAGSGWNQYAYGTNPNSQIDPSGLLCIEECGDPGSTPGWGLFFPYAPGFIPSSYAYGPNAYLGVPGGGFSFGFDASGFDSGCDSDFMPCGLPMPGLLQALGLPSLSCPQWMGPQCGGINPIMDATNCPDVPSHPGFASINDNIRTAQLGSVLEYGMPFFGTYVFYNAVKNKSPWDYKQYGLSLSDTGQLGPSPYLDFGNFNYGAVGAAWGIPLDVLQRAAGYAQVAAGTSKPEWGHWYSPPPHGDDPADQAQILAGYQYYQNGCYK